MIIKDHVINIRDTSIWWLQDESPYTLIELAGGRMAEPDEEPTIIVGTTSYDKLPADESYIHEDDFWPECIKQAFPDYLERCNKEYWVAQVDYEKEVGNDRWYFYFDPITYAMEVYQFYHEESKNDGEYILLTEEIEVNGIKMPKNRAWYYNKNHEYANYDKYPLCHLCQKTSILTK